MKDGMILALKKELHNTLDAEADRIIEDQVNEFRDKLLKKKSTAIFQLVSSIEILVEDGDPFGNTAFNIIIKSGRGV